MARLAPVFWDSGVVLRWFLGEDSSDAPLHVGILNVYEVVHQLLRIGRRELARRALDLLTPSAEPLTPARIWAASELRLREKHRGLSYADAAGYVTAREISAVFVTTDSGFKGLPGVKVVQADP